MSLALSSAARADAYRSAPGRPVRDLTNGPFDAVSPELALVDPELARRARLRLHEPGAFRPAPRRAGAGSSQEVLEVDARPSALTEIRRALEVDPMRTPSAPAPRGPVPPPCRGSLGARAVWRRRCGWAAMITVVLVGGVGMSWERQEPRAEPAVHASPPRLGQPAAARVLTVVRTEAATRPRPAAGVKILAWAPAKGAVAYEVQLFRGTRRVLLMRTREPVLRLRPTWRYEGRVVRRERGTYVWYVWPVFPGDRRPPAAIVQTRVTLAPGA